MIEIGEELFHLYPHGTSSGYPFLLSSGYFKMTLRYAHLAPAHKTMVLAILDGVFNGHPNCTITAQSKEKGLRLLP